MEGDYLKHYQEMISLRGLTDHTVKAYTTYIRACLDYLDTILHKKPEAVSWEELCRFTQQPPVQLVVADFSTHYPE